MSTDPKADQRAELRRSALEYHEHPVPGKVAIAGFDDIPEAEFFAPPLTTVRQDFAAVGQASIRLLIDRIENGTGAGDERIEIEPRLIVRASSTPT